MRPPPNSMGPGMPGMNMLVDGKKFQRKDSFYRITLLFLETLIPFVVVCTAFSISYGNVFETIPNQIHRPGDVTKSLTMMV